MRKVGLLVLPLLSVLAGGVRPLHAEQPSELDGNGAGEAGSTLRTALVLKDVTPGIVYKNALTQNDESDYFRITAGPGRALTMEIVPLNPKTTLIASFYDELRTELARGRSVRPGAAVTLAVRPRFPTTFLRVTRELGDEPTGYEIRLHP